MGIAGGSEPGSILRRDPARVRVLVSGRVQGVFFRASAVEQARARGVAGGVRNLPDGRVEAVFQGSPEAVAACVEWCRRGPPGARVSGVEEIPEVPILEESDFHILW